MLKGLKPNWGNKGNRGHVLIITITIMMIVIIITDSGPKSRLD